MSELREFLESDLSNLEEGSSCLCRHEDGIWYPAKITGFHQESPNDQRASLWDFDMKNELMLLLSFRH